jgi:hypothetical protein
MMDGALIVESLRVGVNLRFALRVRRLSRFEATGATPEQPPTWTLLEFEAADEDAERLAAELSGSLNPVGGWYADFHTADEKYVVFAGRVFRYPRHDRQVRERAQQYARSVGVPETQIDWAD